LRIIPGFDPEFTEETKFREIGLEILPMQVPYTQQCDFLIALAGQVKDTYRDHKITPTIVLDASGIGVPILDVLKDRMREGPRFPIFPIRYTGGYFSSHGQKSIRNVPKSEIFQTLMITMQNGLLEIDDSLKHAPTLRSEMQNFKIKYHENGVATMEAAGTAHDDLLCSVADAIYFLKKKIRGYAVPGLPERRDWYYAGGSKPPGL